MATMTLPVNHRYLRIPVRDGAERRWISIYEGHRPVDQFWAEIDAGAPENQYFLDLSEFTGRNLTLYVDGDVSLLDAFDFSDELPADLYRETLRPRFHFTSKRGWINDPNGLFHLDGWYHLFYQHDPFSRRWGNMHWGHARSRDLVHWEELGDAVRPDALGPVFSGSAVVDRANASGLGNGKAPPVLLFYTAAGGETEGNPEAWWAGRQFTQCVAFSTDAGRTFQKYAKNPVLPHVVEANRDPRVTVLPGGTFLMVLYLRDDVYGLFTSGNLLDWREASRISLPGCSECPDLYRLPLDGARDDLRWVLSGAAGHYIVGDLESGVFQPLTEPRRLYLGDASGGLYAAQTFENQPGHRRVQMAWAVHDIPGMPFNQSMGVPCDLTLRTTERGPRLFAEPVPELDLLRSACSRIHARLLDGEEFLLDAACHDFVLDIGTMDAAYDLFVGETRISAADGRIAYGEESLDVAMVSRLRILADRTFTEVFFNDGELRIGIGDALAERPIRIVARREMTVAGFGYALADIR